MRKSHLEKFVLTDSRPRVRGDITETAGNICKRLWEGGCGRGGDMSTGKRKLLSRRA